MKQCPACRKTYDDTTMFCTECGVGLNAVAFVQSASEYQNSRYIPDKGIKEMFFSTKGRLNRKRYILRNLVMGAASSVGGVVASTVITGALYSDSTIMLIAASLLVLLMVILPLVSGFMMAVRRWHDLNRPGILAITNLLILPALYLLFAKGTEGPNKYGPDPLQIISEI